MEDGAIFKLFRCYTDLIVTVPAVGTHTLLMLPADKSFIIFSFFGSRTTQGAKNPKYDTYTSNGAGNSQMLLDCHTEWKWNIKFLFCFQLSKTQWSLRFCIFSDAMKQNHINGKDTETYLVKSLRTYFLATLGETSCKHNTDMLLSFTVRWYGELVSVQVSIDTFNWYVAISAFIWSPVSAQLVNVSPKFSLLLTSFLVSTSSCGKHLLYKCSTFTS